MSWSKVAAQVVTRGAKLLGGLLAGGPPGVIAAAASIAADALGVDATPDAIETALRTDPDAAVKLRTIESNERVRLAELAAQRITEDAETERTNIVETQRTIRAEVSSDDEYVRRTRPWLLRIIGRTICGQAFASLAIVAIGIAYNRGAESLQVVVAVNQALATPEGILCAAAGVYIHHRSRTDKAIEAGREAPPGMFDTLIRAVRR